MTSEDIKHQLIIIIFGRIGQTEQRVSVEFALVLGHQRWSWVISVGPGSSVLGWAINVGPGSLARLGHQRWEAP